MYLFGQKIQYFLHGKKQIIYTNIQFQSSEINYFKSTSKSETIIHSDREESKVHVQGLEKKGDLTVYCIFSYENNLVNN